MTQKNITLKMLLISVILFSSTILPNETSAQMGRGSIQGMGGRPSMMLGIRTGYDYNAEVWSLGGQFRLSLGGIRGGFQIIPSGDAFFINGNTDWQVNLDVTMHLMMLYGGVGLAYLNRDFQQPDEKDYKSGINYFIGMPLPLPLQRFRLMPYLEARCTEVDATRLFRLVVGVNFVMGKRR